jgi:hypothetical protein
MVFITTVSLSLPRVQQPSVKKSRDPYWLRGDCAETISLDTESIKKALARAGAFFCLSI